MQQFSGKDSKRHFTGGSALPPLPPHASRKFFNIILSNGGGKRALA